MAKPRAPSTPPPTPDDAALFRSAIGPVRELSPSSPPPAAPKPPPRPRQREADEAEALVQSRARPFDLADASLGDAVEYLREGLAPQVLRQLKRGQFSVRDELDLHNMTSPSAAALMRRFLHECRLAERYCVRIVHGKGLRSGSDGPVLKGVVEHLLRQRSDVLAYASAPAAQGGTGAVLVLLARRRAGEAGAVT